MILNLLLKWPITNLFPFNFGIRNLGLYKIQTGTHSKGNKNDLNSNGTDSIKWEPIWLVSNKGTCHVLSCWLRIATKYNINIFLNLCANNTYSTIQYNT